MRDTKASINVRSSRDRRSLGKVAMRPGVRRRLAPLTTLRGCESSARPQWRAQVEHPFLYVKRHFGYAKVRYRGLGKNTQRTSFPYWGSLIC